MGFPAPAFLASLIPDTLVETQVKLVAEPSLQLHASRRGQAEGVHDRFDRLGRLGSRISPLALRSQHRQPHKQQRIGRKSHGRSILMEVSITKKKRANLRKANS